MQNRLLVLQHVLTAYAGLFLLRWAPVAHAQLPTPAGPVHAIKCGRLLDVRTGRVLANRVVLVQGGTILQAGANVAIPAGAEVVELGNALVLTGLVDAHTHLLPNYQPELGGDDTNMLVTVATTSTARLTPEAQALVVQEHMATSGVEEARPAVRQALYNGADCSKTEGHNTLIIKENTQQAPGFSNQHTNGKSIITRFEITGAAPFAITNLTIAYRPEVAGDNHAIDGGVRVASTVGGAENAGARC